MYQALFYCMSDKKIYKVSELNREARTLVEGHFSLVEVEGEISNFIKARSGHLYFTLKDAFAQVRCAMFKMRATYLHALPKDGDMVRIRARVSLYENRGDFQLIVDHLQLSGEGMLQLEFERLKSALEQQGVFDPAHKKPLPVLPQSVGVITSAEGAAVRDIISVLGRRYPAMRIIVYPVRVQGEGAKDEIVAAIEKANARNEVDLLIIGRGGGSLEDLWAFNEESVAKAIFGSTLPTISAVGHEIDFTIADFVADVRAPTPSAAAEMISPDRQALHDQLINYTHRLHRAVRSQHREYSSQIKLLIASLRDPHQQLQQRSQQIDELELRLHQQIGQFLKTPSHQLQTLEQRLKSQSPMLRLKLFQTQSQHLQQRLFSAIQSTLQQAKARYTTRASELDIVSPLATLNRGYAIARNPDKRIIRKSVETNIGDRIEVLLSEGSLQCSIEQKDHD